MRKLGVIKTENQIYKVKKQEKESGRLQVLGVHWRFTRKIQKVGGHILRRLMLRNQVLISRWHTRIWKMIPLRGRTQSMRSDSMMNQILWMSVENS